MELSGMALDIELVVSTYTSVSFTFLPGTLIQSREGIAVDGGLVTTSDFFLESLCCVMLLVLTSSFFFTIVFFLNIDETGIEHKGPSSMSSKDC